MDKKTVRSWVMYDWANSAFVTTVGAAVFPVFYQNVAGADLPKNVATSWYAYTNSIAMLLVLVLSPILGAIADLTGMKKRFLRIFCYAGILSTVLMVFIGKGDVWTASILFITGTIGYTAGNTFYNAMLTELFPYEQRDMISAKGFAYGYIGGGVLLAVNLLMIEQPHWLGLGSKLAGTKASFVSVGIWWFLFSLPIFKRVPDVKTGVALKVSRYAGTGFGRIWRTLRTLHHYPELLKYLIAFLLFNDGISTVITMAAAYGNEIGIGTSDLILALLMTQFIGIPFTLLFGRIAVRAGTKKSLYVSLCIYILVITLGYFMTSAWEFYVLAAVVGCIQGGSQSIARSIYSKLAPQGRSGEFFGFLSIAGKASAVLGPLMFGLAGQLTGSGRTGIISLAVFFIAGLFMLRTVNLEKGRTESERTDVAEFSQSLSETAGKIG